MTLVYDKVPKILIIDDEEGYRSLLEKSIYTEGMEAIVAANGIHARNVLKSNSGVDLIVCDINMPKESGIEFLSWLRKQNDFKNIPVIMVTACKDEEKVKATARHGIDAYLVKPYKKNELIVKIQQALLKRNKLRESKKVS